MPEQTQNFANHVRYDPAFHFFLLPVALAGIISTLVGVIRHPSLGSAWLLVVALAAATIVTRMRIYAIRLQNRVVRLEERLRLQTVLPENLRARIGDLTESQLIGLRFASDAELPALVERALREKLTSTDIKKAVTQWKPDYSRV